MYKEDLALNNLQWLICHKTQPNQTKQSLLNMSDLVKIGALSIYLPNPFIMGRMQYKVSF